MSHDAELVDEVAEAIFDVVVDHPMWLGDDGKPLDYNPDREARICDCAGEAARAVLDALDLPGRERRAKAEALLQAADAWRAMQTHRPPDSAPDTIEGWLMMRSTRVGSEEGDHE